MERPLSVVAEEGVDACVRGDRVGATRLLGELMGGADLTHPAARDVCRLYDDALGGLTAGRFDGALALFQALRGI